MGNKTIKWKYGEKLLIQAVMDEDLHDLLTGNIFVAGYEFSETVSDRDGNQVPPLSTAQNYVLCRQTQLLCKNPHCPFIVLHSNLHSQSMGMHYHHCCCHHP